MDEVKYELELIKTEYPRIHDKIILLWGYPEFDSMMNKLLLDNRINVRQGFPVNIAKSLIKIHDTHMKLYPTKTSIEWDLL